MDVNIKEIKKDLKIKDQDIAEWFGYKNRMSYYNAKKGKSKIEQGIERMYNHMKSAENTET